MREFICEECKRIIFVLVEPEEDDPRDLCVHCLFHPGWSKDPLLVAIFDGRPPRSEAEA
jgi:hypothetical protein